MPVGWLVLISHFNGDSLFLTGIADKYNQQILFLTTLNLIKRVVVQQVLFLFLVASSSTAFGSSFGNVDEIEITGNNKTQPVAILQELLFKPGDTLTEKLMQDSEQAVKNMGLFKEVELLPLRRDGKLIVKISVEEKRFTFVLPKLARSGDGDITTGIVWRSDNVFGLNQRSKFTLAYKKFKDTEEKDETEVKWEYHYPRISNTPYSFKMNIGREQTSLEETIDGQSGNYERTRVYVEPFIGRWLKRDGASRGVQVRGGLLWQRYEHEFVSGTDGLFPDPTVKAVVASMEGDFVHDMLLSRSGHHYGYELTYAGSETGSTVELFKQMLFYRKYIPLPKVDHSNINLQARLGHTTNSILGPPQFNIAGSRSLRGYERDHVEGNSFLLLNGEWLQPIFNKETVRGAFIMDVGDAWESDDAVKLSDLKYSVGFGLRWKLKRYVKTDIRLDVAHGFSEGGTTKVYLGTNSTF
ncbi:MAG: BamA/TamA family outer membrane protein [Gammaproteobacteria bacterium]|nr:BamA/TamA family outer membrane protein [Gammaproteobacteria bacterium]